MQHVPGIVPKYRVQEVYRHTGTVDIHWTMIYRPWVWYTELLMLHISSLRYEMIQVSQEILVKD